MHILFYLKLFLTIFNYSIIGYYHYNKMCPCMPSDFTRC